MMLKVGEIYDAKIVGIKKFGAFVKLSTGESGMVHISEVSSGFVRDIESVLSENQEVKVKLINVTQEGKLAFSIKQAAPPSQNPKEQTQNGILWHPKEPKSCEDMSFEDMMARFKSQSEEKLSDYKKSKEVKRGGGSSKKK
ncbi:MAG: S1 RNA-binding domain-containing protein [Oscillospiraceae bacterium]